MEQRSKDDEALPEEANQPCRMITRSMARADPSLRPTSPASENQVESLLSPPSVDVSTADSSSQSPVSSPAAQVISQSPDSSPTEHVGDTSSVPLPRCDIFFPSLQNRGKSVLSQLPYHPPTPPQGQKIKVTAARETPVCRAGSSGPFGEDLDALYQQRVKQRKLLESQQDCVASLQQLTLDVIVELVRKATLCRKLHELLAGLPGPLLSMVHRSLPRDLMLDCYVQKQMITQFSHEVTLTFCAQDNWTLREIPGLLDQLDKCKGGLRSLVIGGDMVRERISADQLNKLVETQCNVQELCLSRCFITDATLAVIASNCPNIRVLNISCNREVTDAGLSLLSVGCANIQKLNINETSFSLPCIAELICKLPQLRDIQMGRSYVSGQLKHTGVRREQLCVGDVLLLLDPAVRLLNLRHLELHFDHGQVSDKFIQILKMVPNVSQVKLDNCPGILPLFDLTNVETLQVSLLGAADTLDLPNLVLKFADTLTQVHVSIPSSRDNIKTLDVGLFGICPNLEKLYLSGFHLNCETEHKVLPHSFEKLVNVSLDHSGHVKGSITDEILIKMITSQCLEELRLEFIDVPDHVITDVAAEALTNVSVFANLRRLSLGKQGLSFHTVILLISALPQADCIDGEFRLFKYIIDCTRFMMFKHRNGLL